MSICIRNTLLAASVILAAGVVVGQDSGAQYFPYDVDDRWVYDVQGTTSGGEAIDAQGSWTLSEIRPSAVADTLIFDTVRSDSDGLVRDRTCVLVHIRDGYHHEFLEGQRLPSGLPPEEYTAHRDVCRAEGGFPFSSGSYHTSYYPYLHHLTLTDSSGVRIGSLDYPKSVATAHFGYGSYIGPRDSGWISTKVNTVLAEGVGIVETTVIEDYHLYSVSRQLDTLHVRLVGAEVSGVIYGDIGAVVSQPEPENGTFVLRVGPNPSRNIITATAVCPRDCQVVDFSLLDSQGRTLMTRSGREGTRIRLDLSRLPSGLYTLRAESINGVQHRRVTLIR